MTARLSAMAPLAAALWDHFNNERAVDIEFRRGDGLSYHQSSADYFHCPAELTTLEESMLCAVVGPAVDVGAGAGQHCLKLQSRDIRVTGIDIDADMVALMKRRGVARAVLADVFDFDFSGFNTALFMFESIGLCGSEARLRHVLGKLKRQLGPGGHIIFDSAPFVDADDNVEAVAGIELQLRYAGSAGELFRWLYLDAHYAAAIADELGLAWRLIYEDHDAGQYAMDCVIPG